MTEDKDLLCCFDCGCTNVQVRAWVDINTNAFVNDCDDDDCWCPYCCDYVSVCTVDDFEKRHPDVLEP